MMSWTPRSSRLSNGTLPRYPFTCFTCITCITCITCFTCAGGRGQHRAANGRGGVAALLVSDVLALLVLVVQADADNNGLLTVEEVFKLIVWSHDEPLYPDGNLI
jgi:hypothetical protein